jgi:hypothetical protein
MNMAGSKSFGMPYTPVTLVDVECVSSSRSKQNSAEPRTGSGSVRDFDFAAAVANVGSPEEVRAGSIGRELELDETVRAGDIGPNPVNAINRDLLPRWSGRHERAEDERAWYELHAADCTFAIS